MSELKTVVETLNQEWHQFKATNDEALKTGASDVKAMKERMNEGMSKLEDQIESVKTALNRSRTMDKAGEISEMKSSKSGLKLIAKLAKEQNEFSGFLRGKGHGEFATEGWSQKAVVGNSTTGADGGYGIPTVIQPVVDLLIQETSPIEQLAQVTNVGYASDGFHGVIDLNTAGATWGAEPVNGTSDRPLTDSTTFARVDIKYWELFANVAMTLQVMEDATFDVEGEVLRALGDKLGRARAAAFVNGAGDGSYAPKGFAAYTQNVLASNAADITKLNTVVGKGTGATANTIVADDVYNLVYGLRTGYDANASFAAHRLMIQQIRELKSTTGQYLWAPADAANFNALAAGQAGTLAGHDIYRFNDMASTGTAVSGVAPVTLMFADWKNFYRIVNRVGLMMIRDPYTQTGQVVFKTRQRVGGGIYNGVAGVGLTLQQS